MELFLILLLNKPYKYNAYIEPYWSIGIKIIDYWSKKNVLIHYLASFSQYLFEICS